VSRRLLSVLSLEPASGSIDGRPRAPATEPMSGPLVLDLVAAVIQSGAPPQAALRSVGAALQTVDDPRGAELLLAASRLGHLPSARSGPILDAVTDRAGGGDGSRNGRDGDAGGSGGRLMAVVEEALSLAARSGLPPTPLVRRAAVEERRRQISRQLKAIRRLEVLLVIPAGLCLLPAFVLLGIVPLVIQLITG
jgi:tight adherence protein B